jgi:protein-disulfide isomerase
MTSPITPPQLSRLRLGALTALAASGLWVSDLLTREHIALKLGDTADSGVCGASELFSCKTAAASEYGSLTWQTSTGLVELPIAALGEAYYLTALITLIAAGLSLGLGARRRETLGVKASAAVDALAGASALSALYSVFLGAVSALQLGTLCPLCAWLYVVNISSFALLWGSRPREGRARAWGRAWVRAWGRAGLWSLVGLMGASLIASQGVYAQRFAAAHQAAKARAAAPEHVSVEPGDSPRRGDSTAAVIVEFSDFECPYCRRFAKQLKEAQEELRAEGRYDVSYVFKHYPLSTSCNPHAARDLHPRACHAAAAAICAEEQGRFWEMHDALFKGQGSLEDEHIAGYAREVGLDLDAFGACLASERPARRISADIRAGRQAKLKGTPGFYVNGWRFAGAVGIDKLVTLVKQYAYGVLPEPEPEPEPEPKPEPKPEPGPAPTPTPAPNKSAGGGL